MTNSTRERDSRISGGRTKNDRPVKRKSRRLPTSARKKRFSGALFIGAFILSAGGLSYLVFERDRVPRIDPSNLAQVAIGRRIYADACASCHGVSLEGQANWQTRMPNGRLPAPPHDASGHTWHHADEVLFRITKYGRGAYTVGYQTDMPAFETRLTDDEIAASLAFIKSIWPPEIRAKQSRIEAGARLNQQ